MKIYNDPLLRSYFAHIPGIGFVLALVNQTWLVALAMVVLWCLLYMTSWGRWLWLGRPSMLIELLAVPICFSPAVLAHLWFEQFVPLMVFAGLAAATVLTRYALKNNKDLFDP